MSNKDINKEAYKLAEEALMKNRVDEVKEYILETLTKIEKKKKEKEKVEEELRILKLDLEDLRNGNFKKIKERCSKSALARAISVPIDNTVSLSCSNSCSSSVSISESAYWNSATGGTYTVNGSLNGIPLETKTFYF